MARKVGASARRIQFEFSEEAVARLEALKERTGSVSYAEVIRASCRLLEYMLDVADDKDGSMADYTAFKDWARRTVRIVVS